MTNQKNKKHHQNAAPAFPARDRRFQMTNAPKPLTASAIKYLLILLELCKNETGARCMDIAGQLHVTKPSVHSMIGNLCGAGGEEKIRQRLSDARGPGRGRALCGLLSAAVQPDAAVAGPERRGRVQRGLRRARAAAPAAGADADKKGRGIMELLTSVLVAGGICVCIGAVKAVCRRLNRK